MRLVVGITGASGIPYAVTLLETLKKLNIQTHLIVSQWAKQTIEAESSANLEYIVDLASSLYDENNLLAPIASGSYLTNGMVIVPCSMKTLANISNGVGSNLICRAADVCLKERRTLVVVARETPLNLIHLENMVKLTKAGGIILPPAPAFYQHPLTIQDVVNHTVDTILRQFGVDAGLSSKWGDEN